ncbi:MAG TPA: protein-disulfide reductase DsbD domain-containing protein [Terriglobales bacterium]|jgi:DsbC/DsbD-like thiol-disulfide interchange protein|nr:protein-disulfide reductase DsbD domain-containing protein [Terriglobales bacterium]
MDQGTLRALGCRIAALLVAFCGISSAYSQAAKQHARLSLVSDKASLAPGNSHWIGLRFELEPGWHIYWTNPGDSGEPPKVSWHLPSGVEAGDLQFPAPQRIADHGLMDYGYQGHVVLLSKVTVPASVTSKKAEIAADVRYLVCREVCVPAKEHLAVTLPLDGNKKESSEAGLVRTATANLPQSLPKDVHASAVSDQDSFVLTVASKNKNFGPVTDFIPAEAQTIENASLPAVQHVVGTSRLRLKKSEQLTQPISTLRGLLITKDKAYEVNIPVTASKNSGAKGSSKKAISQKVQAPTSN